jgi:pyruvate/2-oxoglutarate dehydrogenase complex dihydrolipoamide acyltransferase (E2) component
VQQVQSGFLVNIMRMVLMTALALVATMAWADEPSAPNAKSETAAETTADQPAAPAQANATEATAKAAEADKPFKPPTGYRAKRVNGSDVYCTKVVVLGSRFPKEDCRTEAQLRDLEAQKASMRGEMEQRNKVCASGNGACGAN